MDYIRGQLCGFNGPSGHMGPVIFQGFSMNAYKEHKNKKNNKKTGQKGKLNWPQPRQCTVTAGNGLPIN